MRLSGRENQALTFVEAFAVCLDQAAAVLLRPVPQRVEQAERLLSCSFLRQHPDREYRGNQLQPCSHRLACGAVLSGKLAKLIDLGCEQRTFAVRMLMQWYA